MKKMISTNILVLCFIVIATPILSWQSLRNTNKGTASITYEGNQEINEWHYTYKTNRKYEVGASVWASPALTIIAGHPMLFIGGYDQTMHALDLITKKVLWRKITNNRIEVSPVVSEVMGRPTVFFSSRDRTLYAQDAITGKKLFTKELIKPTSTLNEASLSSPCIIDNRIYITCFAYDKSLPRNKQKGYLFCLDKKNGNILSKQIINTGFLSSPVSFNYNNKDYIAVAAKRGLIQCFDVTNIVPEKVWDYQLAHEILGSPAVTTNTQIPLLFIGSKYGNAIALEALTGERKWSYMTGNFLDNTFCIGEIKGREVVYLGSHDYNIYALDAEKGDLIWRTHVGGEIYSAPTFFYAHNQALIGIASLDNHIYIIDAVSGRIETSFFTGDPIWDKISKGDVLWGSPVAISSNNNTVIIHGSYNGTVFVLPVLKECTLTAMARSVKSLWISLIVVLVLFTLIATILIKF